MKSLRFQLAAMVHEMNFYLKTTECQSKANKRELNKLNKIKSKQLPFQTKYFRVMDLLEMPEPNSGALAGAQIGSSSTDFTYNLNKYPISEEHDPPTSTVVYRK
ncbi:hypothetical protein WICPIJ_004545 [Wickerhamomyces pijperi]|uniref:Uncharacterized protein n=1 Tax=Wickerhamomyces pijperi TaxID=599730 RepID=A0A9P8Q7F8_WICPI|nr:hypothetical protein WICPIJ_004545 [Wickerhamomyces pijperi]